MGTFYITGQMIPSNTGRSYRVFIICQDKTRIFIGLISRKEIYKLLKGEVSKGNICKFADSKDSVKVAQETLDYSNQPSKGAIAYFG